VYGAWPALKLVLCLNCSLFKKPFFELPDFRPCSIHIVRWRSVVFIEVARSITKTSLRAGFAGPLCAVYMDCFSTPEVRLASPRVGYLVSVQSAKFPALAHCLITFQGQRSILFYSLMKGSCSPFVAFLILIVG
jgi:hypothetical protein